METRRSGYRVFVVKPEGKISLGRRKSSWEDNIKIITIIIIIM